jgi:hypothetical protein
MRLANGSPRGDGKFLALFDMTVPPDVRWRHTRTAQGTEAHGRDDRVRDEDSDTWQDKGNPRDGHARATG